jgi:Leu/Phe-tRNA-protein transferase
MIGYPLRYTPGGLIFLDPDDECDQVVDGLLDSDYNEEFCIATSFDVGFISRLMQAGFLVMSTKITAEDSESESPIIILPKLQLVRSVLLFPDLHIKKNIRRFLDRYELRMDSDFDTILDKCVAIHGDDWLTPPLIGVIKTMRKQNQLTSVKPVSFGLYREGQLKAGEIGMVVGGVYTSYTGFYEENNAGTIQMIQMVKWLGESGFGFLDFGMPMNYKTDLGAQNIPVRRFVDIFRAMR